MELIKENNRTAERILLIFSKYAGVRRLLPDLAKGRHRLLLSAADTGLEQEVAIELTAGEHAWLMEGKELNDKTSFYFYTKRNEKLLLLLSGKQSLKPADRIFLEEEEKLKIGSAFKNRIFFECFSLIENIHVEICRKGQVYIVENPGYEGIYLNEKAMTGKKTVYSGDRVDLYGLHLFFLEKMIICVSFCGICRVADTGKSGSGKAANIRAEAQGRQKGWVERKCGQEEELYSGEMELLLPEKIPLERRQPLILSLGPTMTMILPMLLMAQMMGRYMEGAGSGFYYISVFMSGCSALLGLLWGLAGHYYEKHMRKKEESQKERQYTEYLEKTREKLLYYQSENRRILEQKYPPASSFLGKDREAPVVLWNRYYKQDDFLFFRFGTGKMPFQMKIKFSEASKSIVPEKLTEEAVRMAESFTFLGKVPVGINFCEDRRIGIVGDMDKAEIFETVLLLCMQAAASHCYTEVKTACFYQEEKSPDRRIANCLRWMPHSWSADKRTRFLAGNEKEAGEILPVLTREIMKECESGVSNIRLPWYIVIILNEELILGESFYHCVVEPDDSYPMSVIFVKRKREELPKSCRCFVRRADRQGEIVRLGQKRIERQIFEMEECKDVAVQRYVRQTAGFRVQEKEEAGRLPETVDFLRLYRCDKVEELNSSGRWKLARTEERMKVPVGMGAGKRFISLDVHEKFHGPHGLIAGTTGSGKSELLQTYLLSIAINFSPEDVSFFMIDYKGGGTGNLLKDLPHCAGVISNLSGKQIKRAMSAIASENRRRQKLLSDFQVNHIDGYTKLYREGKARSAMPHLLLVIDEFAELKREEPEFMQEIISLAQVGRSLGVHLLLATQKPAGTVDERIWSNARFRLCLRVQDRQDSLDMLHNGDAAALTAPGRCYLQIGNNEYYELFQAGYCGGIYREEGERKAKAVLLSNTGRRLEKGERPGEEKHITQIEAVIMYIRKTSKNGRYLSAPSLWLPELPGKVFLEKLEKKEKTIVIGLCDDPENQRHFPFVYSPWIQGHLALCGSPASGKTTFLQTILWQLCMEFSTEEVLFLTADMRQEGLSGFEFMPHCLGRLREKKNINVFFYHLERLISRRKKELSGISCRQFNDSGKKSLPLIFLVIDNYGTLRGRLSERQEELILKLAAEGLALGIYLILSAAGADEIGGKLYEKIKTAFALEMSDRFQYGDILRQYYIPVLPEENQKGRGLCKAEGRILEFQTALFKEEQTEYGCAEMVMEEGKNLGEKMKREGKDIPARFPEIPPEPSFEQLVLDFDWKGKSLPLGYCLSTGNICAIEPEKAVCFLISGNEKTGKNNLLSCMAEGALRRKHQVIILDNAEKMAHFKGREGIVYLTGESEIENWRRTWDAGQSYSVFISDIGRFCSFIYRAAPLREEKIKFWENAVSGKGRLKFAAGICHPNRDYEAAGTGFFRAFTAWQQGVHLGGNAASQRIFSYDDLSYTQQNQPEPPGVGYLKKGAGSRTQRLLLPFYGKVAEKYRKEADDDSGGYTDAGAG